MLPTEAVNYNNIDLNFQEDFINDIRYYTSNSSLDNILNQLQSSTLLYDLYQRRNYKPIWVNHYGLTSQGKELITHLNNADNQGLIRKDYNLSEINKFWLQANNIEASIDRNKALIYLDFILTDAFFIYISDISAGRLNPDTGEREFIKSSSEVNYFNLLYQVIENGNLGEIVKSVNPDTPKFKALLEVLEKYQSLLDNRSKISNIKKMQSYLPFSKGDINIQIKLIRERLQKEPGQTINLKNDIPYYFDDKMVKAVKDFQKRYNLNITGIVDAQTLDKLNIPIETIINKIKINIERWRWLPQNLGDRYILVNLPEYKKRIYENNEIVMEMKTVIGQITRQTPTFSDRITHLVFNPRWYVPRSIAVNDHLPKVKEDISFLERNRMKVYKRTKNGFKQVEPEDVNWNEINKENFNYYFWQDSGPWNSLGKVVFRSPASNNIYLHDTPAKHLFNVEERNFSSGCVRLENALKLANYLLQDHSDWDWERIISFTDDGYEKTVFLPEPIPLHIVYWTVWTDDNNLLHLRNDIYNRDQKLKESFTK